MNKLSIMIVFLSACAFRLSSQENVTTFGIQFKPIFSSALFGTGTETINEPGFTYNLSPGRGFSGGMVIRKGFTKSLSLEFGINFTQRNYNTDALYGAASHPTSFRIVGYEIPLSQLVFIRLGENMWMNASAGFCLNMFPSDIEKVDTGIVVFGGRYSVLNPSLLANIGFEYRTDKSGYFYLGASLNRPFQPIYRAALQSVQNNDLLNIVVTDLRGSYLTIDFRYFFHEDPQRKKPKPKKKKKEPQSK